MELVCQRGETAKEMQRRGSHDEGRMVKVRDTKKRKDGKGETRLPSPIVIAQRILNNGYLSYNSPIVCTNYIHMKGL